MQLCAALFQIKNEKRGKWLNTQIKTFYSISFILDYILTKCFNITKTTFQILQIINLIYTLIKLNFVTQKPQIKLKQKNK